MATVRTRGAGGTAVDPYVTGAQTTRRTTGQTQQVNAPPMQAPAPSPYALPPTTFNSGTPLPYTPRSGNTGISGYGFPSGTTPPPLGSADPYTGGSTMPTSWDPTQLADLFRQWFGGTTPSATPGGTTSPYSGTFDLGAFQRAAGTAAQGQSGSLDDFVNNIFPSLQSQFPGIERFGSKGDKIRLPNGQVIDAVLSAGAGGRGYNWEPEMGGGGYFNDPLLSQFANLGQYGISQLLAPQGIHPVLQQALTALTGLLNAPDPGMSAFGGIANKRLAQLDQPAYTDAQRAMIATNFTEPLEAQRSARKQQALERAAARGLAPSSGLLELDTRDIDRSFDQVRGEGERQLALSEIAANEARQQEAVQIGQALASLSGRNLPIQMSAAGQLAGIGNSLQNEPTNRLLQAMGISGQLAALPGMSMNNALSALNMLNPPQTQDQSGQLISLLLGLAGQGENAYGNDQARNQAFWQSIFQMLPGVIGAFSGTPSQGVRA